MSNAMYFLKGFHYKKTHQKQANSKLAIPFSTYGHTLILPFGSLFCL